MGLFANIKRHAVAVEELVGESFFVRSLTEAEIREIDKPENADRRPFLVLLHGLCDKDGRAVLTDADEADLVGVPMATRHLLRQKIIAATHPTKDEVKNG